MRYFDGTVRLSTTDLSSDGFGASWGQARSWSNGTGYTGLDFQTGQPVAFNGRGWVDSQLPFVLPNSDFNTAILVTSATNARFFDNVADDPNPTERFFMGDRIVEQNSEFVVTDTVGDQFHFFDFIFGNQSGQFKSMTDPYGNRTFVVSWNASGTPTEVQRTTPAGIAPAVTESYVYGYVPSGVNAGLLPSP